MYSITREVPTESDFLGRVAWAMKLTVASSDPAAFPPEVFVYQIENPADVNSRSWFTAVASPAQLEEYSVATPAPTGPGQLQVPYFRLAVLSLVSRNASDLQLVFNQVVEELSLLRNNLIALRNLRVAGNDLPLPDDEEWYVTSTPGITVTNGIASAVHNGIPIFWPVFPQDPNS